MQRKKYQVALSNDNQVVVPGQNNQVVVPGQDNQMFSQVVLPRNQQVDPFVENKEKIITFISSYHKLLAATNVKSTFQSVLSSFQACLGSCIGCCSKKDKGYKKVLDSTNKTIEIIEEMCESYRKEYKVQGSNEQILQIIDTQISEHITLKHDFLKKAINLPNPNCWPTICGAAIATASFVGGLPVVAAPEVAKFIGGVTSVAGSIGCYTTGQGINNDAINDYFKILDNAGGFSGLYAQLRKDLNLQPIPILNLDSSSVANEEQKGANRI